MDAPFFVINSGRAGSTLLQMMLSAHPRLIVAPETHWIVRLADRHRASGPPWTGLVRDLSAEPSYRDLWRLEPRQTLRRLAERRPGTVAGAIDEVFRQYADLAGKPRWGDKSPSYAQHVARLAELWPDAGFVHLVRDGRDVASSLLRVPWGPTTIPGGALHWRRSVERAREAGERLGPGRFIEVRYERLVAEPEAELRSVCSFLGEDFDPGMLEFHTHAPEDLVPGANPRDPLRPVDPRARNWRHERTPREIARFEAVAGATLERFGYERAGDAGIPDAAIAWATAGADAAGVVWRRRRGVTGLGTRTGPRRSEGPRSR
ncbi:MAG: sulfotransferase [Actinomycetota bacterium]